MIYFIEAVGAGLIKIGYTAGKAEDRLKQLQTGCPHKLRVLATFDGYDQEDEQRIHRELDHLRDKGEWFRMDTAIILKIVDLKWDGLMNHFWQMLWHHEKKTKETITNLNRFTTNVVGGDCRM